MFTQLGLRQGSYSLEGWWVRDVQGAHFPRSGADSPAFRDPVPPQRILVEVPKIEKAWLKHIQDSQIRWLKHMNLLMDEHEYMNHLVEENESSC